MKSQELKPGEWPERIATELGNRQPFLLEELTDTAGSYRQQAGCVTLEIFND